ncbi:UbiA family prenyltransferase [Porifericola rhodea]|uniref:UbiA family prenyltransferase n=1 Tax=Porifericola rhodea TaxID=930972 RepID=UPI00266594CB|nr:UbiA family prenyltransferase [Porifericola rhodea]WKN33098.1 UbiA family prenyltransferase [Porifericola rhodea]
MVSKSTILHLRIPFSFFLLPVFLFAISVEPPTQVLPTVLVFFILHFLLYPASNAYNSYFDKDKGSIGGLKNPPPVSKELYWVALLLDALALALGLLISWQFSVMLLVYGLVSKAYSHPSVRLKKYAVGSWFIAGFFQGCFTWLMANVGVHHKGFLVFTEVPLLLPAFLSSLMLWGSYPMTQVYQHEEDARRGDYTLSYVLGVKGTFHFTMIVFTVAAIGFITFYSYYYSAWHSVAYMVFLLPLLAYSFLWYARVVRDTKEANFRNTMRLNMISGLSLNLFFLLMLIFELRG